MEAAGAPVRAPFNSHSQTPQTSRSQNLNPLADDSKSDESPTTDGRPASAPLMFNNNNNTGLIMNTNSRPRKARAKWNSRMEEAMLDALIEAQSHGLQTEATYKPAGWQMALDAVQKITSYPVELRQIKSKHDTHKKDWKIWRDFCNLSAHIWEPGKGLVPTGPPQVLDAYFEAHPEARKFRDSPLAFADKLALLLDNHRATGQHASSLSQILQDLDKDEEEVGTLGGANSPPGWPCESIELSEDSSDSTAGSQPSRSPTPNRAKTPRAKSTLALRKRSLENATKAEFKRQKKTGARHLADALQDVVQELKTSCDLLVEANKTPAERVAEILVSEFGELDEVQQDTVFTAIQSSERVSLFLARSKDMRKRWVQRILDDIEPNSQETPDHT